MRGLVKNMAGQRFGRLVAEKRDGNLHGAASWLCKCDCGNTVTAHGPSLRKGLTRSCGCLAKEVAGHQFSTHGQSKTPTYRSWLKMNERCHNVRHHQYADYGGRGITICERWTDFSNFLADMGERPSGTSIDRINNDLGYEPGNCKWSTKTEQARNTRVVRKVQCSDGRTFACVAAAVEIVGGTESALRHACRVGKLHLGRLWAFIPADITQHSEAA